MQPVTDQILRVCAGPKAQANTVYLLIALKDCKSW